MDEPTTRPNLTPDHGRQRETDLPLRVRAEIDRREETAERLIGWVQLGIVLFFALLYAIAPRAEGASGLNFVPLVLSAYLAFTLFRLVLSYRMRLPQWYLILSIVVDVLLLCGLIFSFHIQYMQHPAFYLKAPTLLYLFLFISLRALRFDPLFVLLSGLIGVFGWLAMLAYAMLSDMGGMHVTRNYVEYLTSNSILIGAEIDKILTIVGVTAILALALHRGRQVLFDAIQGQSAANDLRQFFAPEVAHSITRAEDMPATGRGEACHAAILFVDIRSFTTIAEAMEPGTVMAILTRYQDVVLPVIQQHGGRVDKFLGDGILATFGAVNPSATYAADALRAAQGLIVAVEAQEAAFHDIGWRGSFRVGAGVAAGAVTVGVVGAQGRLEFTVIGNPVNLAAKLEGANKAQKTQALTDAETYALAVQQGFEDAELETRSATPVSGVSKPVSLVVLG